MKRPSNPIRRRLAMPRHSLAVLCNCWGRAVAALFSSSPGGGGDVDSRETLRPVRTAHWPDSDMVGLEVR